MTRLRLGRTVLAVVLLAGASALGGQVPAAAATRSGGSSDTLPPANAGPPPSDAAAPPGVMLAPAGADEAGRKQAKADLAAAEKAFKAAVAAQRKVSERLPQLQQRAAEAAAAVTRFAAENRAAAEQLALTRDRVRKMAVADYVSGGDVSPVDYVLRSGNAVDLARRQALVKRATEAKADALSDYDDARRLTSDELEHAMADVDAIKADMKQSASVANAAASSVARLRADVDHHRQLLEVATAAAPVGTSDIPRLFLDSYRRAATTMQKRNAACRVSWTAVAAIGRVESNHGRYRGARLALNGDVYPRIIGIPLDGTRTALVKDSDKGELDGDTVYDRAVGPMQFIPSTWKRIAQDGNSDKRADANNAYDAALGTAAYLCRAVPEGGLDNEDALRRAYFSYNHSPAYVDAAMGAMRAFEAIAPTL